MSWCKQEAFHSRTDPLFPFRLFPGDFIARNMEFCFKLRFPVRQDYMACLWNQSALGVIEKVLALNELLDDLFALIVMDNTASSVSFNRRRFQGSLSQL